MFSFGVKIGVYNVKKMKKLACCHWARIHAVHVQIEISEWSHLNTGYIF